ncbi:MAG: hypothetical protein AB7T59_00540 [Hyphomonadaceae bacterium]
MLKRVVLVLAAALSACAPAPVRMPAAQAAEVLNLFASGRGPASLCSTGGRAVLRGAVRAYSREMQLSGVAWPAMPGLESDAGQLNQVDVSVLVAFAAGFVEAGDFRGAQRLFLNQLALIQWPEIRTMRLAAAEACQDVADLQRAAATFVIESTRYQQMTERSSSARGDTERLQRQSVRLQRAAARMQDVAAIVEARAGAHRL